MHEMTVYLVPHSSFQGNGSPRSDTLFGAICWSYKLLFGNDALERLLQKFTQNSVPFLLTSMFPYAERSGGKKHAFPKPFTNPFSLDTDHQQLTPDEFQALNVLKQLDVVSDEDFSDILYGGRVDRGLYNRILEKIRAQEPILDCTHMMNVQQVHHSLGRRIGSKETSDVFYTEKIVASRPNEVSSGFFFCLKCREDYEQELKTVLYFLADKGIGGGSSVGKGQIRNLFIHDGVPYDEPPVHESSHVVTLSLTFPCEAIRKVLEHSWYQLERRQGKIESMYAPIGQQMHVRKDHLLMLKEGSTFPKNGQSFYGQNRIVRKNDGIVGFDVWQYGYAFTVNTKHIQGE